MKQYLYSIILLVLVDTNYRFIWASIGATGNTHDSSYFQSTDLWWDILSGKALWQKTQNLNGVEIPPIILGDGAFPIRTWLQKPYGNAVLSEEQGYFNFRLSRTRLVIEGAFGRLKSRFRVLHRRRENNKEIVKLMGLACVVLHNICIETKYLVPCQFDLSVDQATNKRQDQNQIRDLLDLTNSNKKYIVAGKPAAVKVREEIKKNGRLSLKRTII